MSKKIFARAGIALAAAALATTLTGCSGGGAQSVKEACDITEEIMTKVTSDAGNLMQGALADGDAAGAFDPLLKGLDEARAKVTNVEVGKHLGDLDDAFTELADAFKDIKMPDAGSTDPAGALADLQKAMSAMEGTQKKMMTAGEGITALCGN